VAGDHDVFKPGIVALDDYIGRHKIARGEFVEFPGRLHEVGHDHRVHEAGDLFPVNVDHVCALVNGNDLALQVITFGGGSILGCAALIRALLAGRGEGCK